MAQWLHMPWFKRTVVGCFVRVNIGAGEQMGKITYRIAEVRDVSESSKIYNLGMFSGKRLKFDKITGLSIRSQLLISHPKAYIRIYSWKWSI